MILPIKTTAGPGVHVHFQISLHFFLTFFQNVFTYCQPVPKYMSMITDHTTVSPAFVSRIVFEDTSCQRGAKQPHFNLPIKFFPEHWLPTLLWHLVFIHYRIQLQFPLSSNCRVLSDKSYYLTSLVFCIWDIFCFCCWCRVFKLI